MIVIGEIGLLLLNKKRKQSGEKLKIYLPG